MDESQVVNSVDPVAPVNEALSHEPAQQAPESTVEAKPAEDRQERNWREMRRQKADLERKLEMQEELLKRLMQQTPPAPPEVDELDQIPDNEFIPKGQVKALVQKQAAAIAEKIAREEAQKLAQQQAQSQFMVRLKAQYPDFDQVVNSDSLAMLEENEPELAQTIADLKDPYKIGMQSYKYLKALKPSENASKRHAKEVEKKLEANQKTVQSPQAFDKRPMAQAFKMTDSELKELYKEMTHYANQASYGY